MVIRVARRVAAVVARQLAALLARQLAAAVARQAAAATTTTAAAKPLSGEHSNLGASPSREVSRFFIGHLWSKCSLASPESDLSLCLKKSSSGNWQLVAPSSILLLARSAADSISILKLSRKDRHLHPSAWCCATQFLRYGDKDTLLSFDGFDCRLPEAPPVRVLERDTSWTAFAQLRLAIDQVALCVDVPTQKKCIETAGTRYAWG